MEIRKDFESASPYLDRLRGYGDAFRGFARNDWPHLKSNEDYRLVYRLDQPMRRLFENLYGDGRDMANFMEEHLRAFNSHVEFPTLTSYVRSFERRGTWTEQLDLFKERHAELLPYSNAQETPWAVRRMIDVWAKQVQLLEATKDTIRLLKQTNIYRLENGEITLSDLNKQHGNNFTFGDGGRVNIQSVDHSSTTISKTQVANHQIFTDLRETLKNSTIPDAEKQTLAPFIDAMETDVGKPGFVQRYKDFIAAAANHVVVFTPMIPGLAALLG